MSFDVIEAQKTATRIEEEHPDVALLLRKLLWQVDQAQMWIYEPGRTVKVGGDIIARVLEVSIRSIDTDEVQYRVSWWDGRTRHAEWVNGSEVSMCDGTEERDLIGFWVE